MKSSLSIQDNFIVNDETNVRYSIDPESNRASIDSSVVYKIPLITPGRFYKQTNSQLHSDFSMQNINTAVLMRHEDIIDFIGIIADLVCISYKFIYINKFGQRFDFSQPIKCDSTQEIQFKISRGLDSLQAKVKGFKDKMEENMSDDSGDVELCQKLSSYSNVLDGILKSVDVGVICEKMIVKNIKPQIYEIEFDKVELYVIINQICDILYRTMAYRKELIPYATTSYSSNILYTAWLVLFHNTLIIPRNHPHPDIINSLNGHLLGCLFVDLALDSCSEKLFINPTADVSRFKELLNDIYTGAPWIKKIYTNEDLPKYAGEINALSSVEHPLWPCVLGYNMSHNNRFKFNFKTFKDAIGDKIGGLEQVDDSTVHNIISDLAYSSDDMGIFNMDFIFKKYGSIISEFATNLI